MKKIVFTEEQILEIKRLYIEEKMGTPSIGELYGVSKPVINRLLKNNEVLLEQSGRRNIGGRVVANKKYAEKNKDRLNEYYKEWSKLNRDALKIYHKTWRDNSPEYRQGRVDYERNRRREDPKYRLCATTRTAVYTCLKERNIAKYRSTFDLLGYTLEELMNHLEDLFTEGMTWDNYGEWHVDHKLPMASFNFESTEDREFKLCWCLDNLQPLWGPDNLSKGSRVL